MRIPYRYRWLAYRAFINTLIALGAFGFGSVIILGLAYFMQWRGEW